jgi:ADP-heptose:LPS heptosyltransferase
MGLGGYLMWTAAFHEIHEIFKKRILPVEVHGQKVKLISSPIFKNNPSIVDVSVESYEGDYLAIPLNNPATNYCKLDTADFAKHRYDIHVIQQILEFYKINKELSSLRCRIYLDSLEEKEVENLLESFDLKNQRFIAIEPNSNDEYTCNREYPFEKWQKIVEELSKFSKIVQVGSSKKILNNVINLTGKTSFRTCAGVIKNSSAFLSSEGGLVHAAQAVKTKSIVVITGYEHPDMISYPNNINLWVHDGHGPCGKKKFCKDCRNAVLNHDELEIIDATKKLLL